MHIVNPLSHFFTSFFTGFDHFLFGNTFSHYWRELMTTLFTNAHCFTILSTPKILDKSPEYVFKTFFHMAFMCGYFQFCSNILDGIWNNKPVQSSQTISIAHKTLDLHSMFWIMIDTTQPWTIVWLNVVVSRGKYTFQYEYTGDWHAVEVLNQRLKSEVSQRVSFLPRYCLVFYFFKSRRGEGLGTVVGMYNEKSINNIILLLEGNKPNLQKM